MKYTFQDKKGKERTVAIDDVDIKKRMRACGLSMQEAIDQYLFDNDYIDNEIVDELTAKAKANGSMRIQGDKPRKPRERKPDLVKRELIDFLYETLADSDLDLDCGQLKNVSIMNRERVISFTIKDDNYELTLSKKRKPKI